MTYYRLAIQNQQTAMWAWKSTVVTSLQTIFQLLRIYSVLPQDRIRVFTFTCKEDLAQTMLNCENNTLAAYFVTATEFLRARKLQTREMAQSGSDRATTETTARRAAAIATALSWRPNSMAPSSFTASGLNVLEKKRLEREIGPGGDHNLPYTFTLPTSIPQVLAWMKLLAKVRNGELQL